MLEQLLQVVGTPGHMYLKMHVIFVSLKYNLHD